MDFNILNWFKDFDDTVRYAAGETVFSAGDTADRMYVVLDGKIDIRVNDHSLDTAGTGDIIGEMSLIDSSARSASAKVLEDCTLAPVDERQFLFMVEQAPYFALHVMKVLAARLRRMDELDQTTS